MALKARGELDWVAVRLLNGVADMNADPKDDAALGHSSVALDHSAVRWHSVDYFFAVDRCGKRVSPADFYIHQTIRAIAAGVRLL
jgi:hypothetical protein